MTDQAPPTVEGLQRQILELQLQNIKTKQDSHDVIIRDHEIRLRDVESTLIEYKYSRQLLLGGGVLNLLTLLGMLWVIFK